MTTFVLVSGAWHAGWCWERMLPLLEAEGCRVLAPDLRGMGPEPTPLSQVTLAVWADQVAEIIRGEAEPVILVGHSRGGIIISEVAERVPERIQRLVYLTAFLIPDGSSLGEASRLQARDWGDYLRLGPDNTATVPSERVGPDFYNTTAPEWVARAISQLTPEPMAAAATPLRLTEARFGATPRAYIECAQDNAMPLTLQREMQQALPCDPVITLDTDHSPFFSAPELLTAALMTIARA